MDPSPGSVSKCRREPVTTRPVLREQDVNSTSSRQERRMPVRDEVRRPRHLAVLGEPLARLALIRRTIPVATRAAPMINIGRKSVSHPGGQWIRPTSCSH